MTDGVLRSHLEHRYAVAVFAGEFSSRFLCFDVDDGRKETVRAVTGALKEMGFPHGGIYISLSGGKGHHIELFFDRLVRTEKLRRIYQRVLELTKLTAQQVEFRPTNGNAIKTRDLVSMRAQGIFAGSSIRIHSFPLSATIIFWKLSRSRRNLLMYSFQTKRLQRKQRKAAKNTTLCGKGRATTRCAASPSICGKRDRPGKQSEMHFLHGMSGRTSR